MLAEISIYPMDAGHISKDIAKVMQTLEQTGLEFRLGPMGTSIEGELEQLLVAIQRCHEAVANDHDRVITNIVLYDDKKNPKSLKEMTASVEQQLGHKLPT